jgi:hypothetical protein
MQARIAAVMVVRDEEEFIEANVRYHLDSGFDVVAVMNHCSRDRTPEILERLKNDSNLIIGHSEDATFDHGHLCNQILRMLLSATKVDWVFPLDADEFLYIPAGLRQFLCQMESMGIKYGSLPWLNAVWIGGNSVSPLETTDFYFPWPERTWQHDGHFRKAFCQVHPNIEVVVGGHYFKKENSPDFFGTISSPYIVSSRQAMILHYELRGTPSSLYRKWSQLARHEADSTSDGSAPWLERLQTIRRYVAQYESDPMRFADYWFREPRTFWGTRVSKDRLVETDHIKRWINTRHRA